MILRKDTELKVVAKNDKLADTKIPLFRNHPTVASNIFDYNSNNKRPSSRASPSWRLGTFRQLALRQQQHMQTWFLKYIVR
jgi:hypothetical protein